MHYVPSFMTFQSVILFLLLAAYVLSTNPIFVVTDDSLRILSTYDPHLFETVEKFNQVVSPQSRRMPSRIWLGTSFALFILEPVQIAKKKKSIKLKKKRLKYTKILININPTTNQ